MDRQPISSISGIRGIFGETLIPENIIKFTKAFSDFSKGDKIVVGSDGRITGDILANLVKSTILFSGKDVIDIGVVPTPTVQLAVEYFNAAGGIAITASHNPIEWNGLKFLSNTGMFLDHEEYAQFQKHCNSPLENDYVKWDKIGKTIVFKEMINLHIQKTLALSFIDRQLIKNKKFKVVVDCVNASGSKIVPAFLEELGCEIIKIHCDSTGIFPHTPEPLPQNLFDLINKVKETKADLGIAVDPDADRLVLICDDGNPFGEELTITQVIKYFLMKEPGKAVINISTTKAVDDIVEIYKSELIKTPVGEINVAKRMKEIGAKIGGEGSGGIILPELHYGRDSLAGIAVILQNLAETNLRLSDLKAALPSYFMTKTKVVLKSISEAISIIDILVKNHKKDKYDLQDGLRIDYESSWVIIRKSNTEPIIRIYSEAKTKSESDSLSEEIIKEINYNLNNK